VGDFNGAPVGELNVPGARPMLAGNLHVADALQALVGGSGYARMFATGETQSTPS